MPPAVLDAPPAAGPPPAAHDSKDLTALHAQDRFLWSLVGPGGADGVAGGFTLEPAEAARLDELEEAERSGRLSPEDEADLQILRDVEHFASLVKIAADRVRAGWAGPAA